MSGNKVEISKSTESLFIFTVILFDVIGIGMIPLNLFLLNMPEYISIIISICLLCLNILLWMIVKQRKAGKIIIALFSIVSILLSLFGTYCNPYWNSLVFRNSYSTMVKDDGLILTQKAALEDLDYAMKYLQKLHPALYHGMPEELEKQYEHSRQNLLNSESIDLCMLAQEIESIFSLLHDGHTHVDASYHEQHYLKYIYEHNQAGDRLVKLNDMSLEELFHHNSNLISYETDAWGLTYIYNYVSTAEGLRYLGISVEDGVKYTYEDVNGSEVSYIFTEEDYITYPEYVEFNHIDTDTDVSTSFVSYVIDAENDVAILTLDSCINNAEYRNCLNEMFTEIKQQGIQNIAVDLRNNGGGSSLVANEFFRFLNIDTYKSWGGAWRLGVFEIESSGETITNQKHEDLLFDGNLYLLTSVYTYSSAMDFAMFVKDNHMGKIIGEASGNHPTSYGDIAFFTLPNSGIYMQISTKKWYRINQELGDQVIEPDIPCDADDAIEYLYNVIKES